MKMEKKREQKRASILRAAWRLFTADGYIGTSMNKVAKEANVTKQTVYRYYESKETLYREVLETRNQESGYSFLDELEQQDLREGLLKFSVNYLKFHLSEEHLAGTRLMFSEGPEAPGMVRARYAVGPAKTQARLLAYIKKHGHAEDPEYVVKMLLSTLLSMRPGVLLGVHEQPSEEEIELHATRTVDCIMPLLR